MKMRSTVMVILILVAVAAMSAGTVYGGRGEMGGRGDHRFPELTEEQRAAVHELVGGMRDAGATRDEIHAAVAELFESWGLEVPEPPEGRGEGGPREGEGRGERRGPGPGFMDQLTEEQRTEVHALVTRMREAGAAREDIRAAVNEMLAGWGIELPGRPEGGPREGGGRGEGRGPGHRLMDQLTEEQRDALHTMVTEMREAGSSRDEIRAAVHALLEGWGIELPEECKGENGEVDTLISPAEGKPATWGKIKGDFK
jgi:hypothetical protein